MEGFTSGATGSGNLRFVQANNFQWAMQATQEDREKYPELVKTRTNKNGVEKTELKTDAIIGHIVSLGHREVPYPTDTGKEFNLELKDSSGTTYRISMKDLGRQASYVLTRLPNIDLTNPIRLGIFKSTVDKGGGDTFDMAQVYIQQQVGGKWTTVQNNFPKDDPKELPPFKSLGKAKGKEVWSNEEQFQWLMDNVALKAMGEISELEALRSALGDKNTQGPPPAKDEPVEGKAPDKSKAKLDPAAVYESGDDDLPF